MLGKTLSTSYEVKDKKLCIEPLWYNYGQHIVGTILFVWLTTKTESNLHTGPSNVSYLASAAI